MPYRPRRRALKPKKYRKGRRMVRRSRPRVGLATIHRFKRTCKLDN